MPVAVHLMLVSIFPAALIGAALRDATSYTIPNWLSAALAIAFFPTAWAIGLSPAIVGQSAALGCAALAGGVAMFAAGWIGGGDAKLLAAASVWLGLPAIAPFLVFTALAGGALACALMVLRGAPLPVARGPAWVSRLLKPKGDVPYGVAIAIGALAAFPSSLVFHAASA